MKRIIALYAAVCVFIFGCAHRPDDRSPTADRSRTKPKIVMWLVGSESQAITINDLARDFYDKTGISVRCDAISWGDAHSKYMTSIAGGVAPDIGTMGLTWATELGELGAMVNLKSDYPEQVNAIKSAIFEGLWNSAEYRGKVYGIPFDLTEYVLFYRTDIIPRPPGTWEELVALLADLKKAGKGMLFDWGSLSWIGYSPFLWQAGGDYYNRDFTAVTVDSPEAINGLEFFSKLYNLYDVPKTRIPIEQGMRTGDFPIAISGNWKLDELRIFAPEISGKWSIAVLPKGPSGRSTGFMGGRVVGIFTQSRRQEESWKFIEFLLSSPVQAKLFKEGFHKQDAYLPPSKDAWQMIAMDEYHKKVLFEQACDSKGPPSVANWDNNGKIIDQAVQKVVLQNSNPRKELARAKMELEKTLKK